MKVIVLGSGVIGVTTAYYLARAGHEVTVVDRQAEPRQETSSPTPARSRPAIPRPGPARHAGESDQMAADAARAAGDLAQLDTVMWWWMLKLLRNCTAERYAINKEPDDSGLPNTAATACVRCAPRPGSQ